MHEQWEQIVRGEQPKSPQSRFTRLGPSIHNLDQDRDGVCGYWSAYRRDFLVSRPRKALGPQTWSVDHRRKLHPNGLFPVCPRHTQNSPETRYACEESNHSSVKIVRERIGDSLRITVGPRVNWLGVVTALAAIRILCGVGITPAYDGLKIAIGTGGSVGGYILGIQLTICMSRQQNG